MNVPIGGVREPLEEITVLGKSKNKIALINISGVISWEERESGILTKGELSIVSRIKEELDKARTDERVKGVILKVDSPGGLVSASEIIYQEMKKIQKRKEYSYCIIYTFYRCFRSILHNYTIRQNNSKSRLNSWFNRCISDKCM